MITRRDARLLNEATLLRAAFSGSPVVEITPVGWDPFEAYRIVYSVPGVVLEGTQPTRSNRHVVLVELGPEYPRLAPRVVTESAIFHPNLGADVGDAVVFDREWTAARTLIDVVLRIGQMLQYQAFDLAEPANAVAANWTSRNAGIFPIGHADIDVQIPEESPSIPPAPVTPPADSPATSSPATSSPAPSSAVTDAVPTDAGPTVGPVSDLRV